MSKLIEKPYVIISIFFIFLLWGIGNPDALRQGTEGFYLLISQEMYSDGYFLTPRLVGDNHWSKPPFHFWLPMPVYKFFTASYLTAARASILILSFLSIFYISKWIEKNFQIKTLVSFFIFFSSFSLIKYSRIYMMEIPFSVLSFIPILLFLDFEKTNQRKYLIFSAILMALAILVKGPVSLAMAGLSLFLFQLTKKFHLKNFIPLTLWTTITLILSSLWFIYCYLTYGDEFYQYFFVRENMGKFTAKNYPVTSVIQGLILYTIPICFFIPSLIKKLKDNFKSDHRISLLIITFLVYFFIWFIPNQKSHHYAIPSTLPFISLIIIFFFHNNQLNKNFRLFTNTIVTLLSMLTMVALTSSIFIDIPYWMKPSSILIILLLIFLIISIYFVYRSKSTLNYFLALALNLNFIWIYTIPLFLLPTTPNKVIHQSADKKVSVVFRKPYFIQEALNKKVEILSHDKIFNHILQTDHYYILPKSVFNEQQLFEISQIMHQWPIWKRGLKPRQIFQALKTGKHEHLVDYMVLLVPKQ